MARNFEQWMRQMEREVREAKRSGVPIAIKYAQDAYDKANEELQQYKDLVPAAPIELTYQTALYTDRDGAVRGRLTIDFPDVVFSTNQTPIQVTDYELHGRAEGYGNVHSAYPGHLLPGQSYPGTPGSVLFSKAKLRPMQRVATSNISSFTVDGITQGQTLRYRVRAAGGTFVQPGLWSQELVIYVEKDTTPPPQPTAPRVRVSRGVIMVDCDGQAVNGPMPADLDRIVLAHGTSSSPTGEVYEFSRSGGTYVLPGAGYFDTQFFRLQAVDQSGNRGNWSEQATGMALPLVDEDVILSRIDAAETIIDNAGALILESGETLTGLLDQSRTDLADTQTRLSETQEKLNYTFPATVNLQFEEAKAAAAADAQAKADAAKQAAITAAALDATAKAEQAEADAALDASAKANQALADAKLDASNKATAAEQAAIDAAALDATSKMEQAEADAALDAQAKADQALIDAKADATAKANAAEEAAKTAAAADATAKAEQAEADAVAAAAITAQQKADAAQQAAITASNNLAVELAKGTDDKIVNGSFEADRQGYTGTPESSVIDSTKARTGTKSWKTTGSGELIQPGFPVTVGDTWRYEWYYQTAAAYPVSAAGGLRLQKSTDGGVTYSDVVSTSLAPDKSTWTRQAVEYVIPTGVTHIRARAAFAYTGGAAAWVDDLRLLNITSVKALEADAQAKADAAQAAAEAAAALDATAKMEQAEADAAADAQAKANQALADAKADATAKANAAEQAAKDAAALDATAKMEQAEADAALDAAAKANQALADAKADATVKADEAERLAKEAAALDATAKAEQAEADAINAAALDATTKANQAKADAQAAAEEYARQQDEPIRQAAEDAQLDADALKAKAENLVLNGSAELGSTTYWAGPIELAMADTPSGFAGAFKATGTSTQQPVNIEKISIDPKTIYRMTSLIKGVAGIKQYLVIRQYDVDGKDVAHQYANRTAGSETTLAAPLNVGDTTITLTDGSGWANNVYCWIGAFPYTSAAGTVYQVADGYTRTIGSLISGTNYPTVSGNTVTLPAPYGGPAMPAGQEVAQMRAGSSYLYPGFPNATGEWDVITGDVGGLSTGIFQQEGAKFRPGTAKVAVSFLLNYQGPAATTYFTGVRLVNADDARAAEAAQQRADEAHTLAGTAESNAQTALTMAGGKSRVYYSANAPSGTGKTDDTWRQTDTNGDVIAEWRWTGAWTSQKITSQAISNLDVGKLTVGTGVISQLVAQHIAAESGEFIELDVSQLRSTTATIDTAVIDKLWTDVVNSRQITTNMLLVGGGENLWVDQYFESTTTTIGAIYTGAEVAPRGSIRTMKVRDHVAPSTTQFEVVPGDTIVVEYTAKRVLGARNLRATVWLWAPDGTGVTSPFAMLSYFSEEIAVGAPDANGWQRYRSTSKIPTSRTDVGKATLYFQIDQTAGAYDTEWLVSDVRLRRAVESAVIVDGAITTRQLTVTEDMTVALLAAHKVQAGEIEVNTLFADATFTGSLDTHVATFLTNEDGTGYTSTVTGQGLKVTYTDPTTGEVMDRVKLGTFDSDYFALTDDTGETSASIDNQGAFTGRTFDVKDDIYLRGESLWTKLDSMGGNMVAWAQVPINDNMSTTSEVGLFELGWEANDDPVRMYEFNLNNLLIDVTQAGVHGLRLRYTNDGSVPTINSPMIAFSYFQTSQAGTAITPSFTRIIGSNNGPYLRVLVTLVEFSNGVAKVYSTGGVGGQTHIYATVKDLGYTLPHTGSATSAGGVVYTGTASTAPTNPTVTYTKEWGYNGVRSYLPSGDTYNYNTSKAYQGQSPAGYGNLSSMYTFPSLTSELSGATIHDVWVYLYFEHWYYNSGGTAEIRLHNNLSVPSTYAGMTTNGVNSTSWPKASGRWVRLPSSLYDGFKTGAYRGFGLTGDGLICYGIANNARIKIKYTK